MKKALLGLLSFLIGWPKIDKLGAPDLTKECPIDERID
jgi:hypothetical protein